MMKSSMNSCKGNYSEGFEPQCERIKYTRYANERQGREEKSGSMQDSKDRKLVETRFQKPVYQGRERLQVGLLKKDWFAQRAWKWR